MFNEGDTYLLKNGRRLGYLKFGDLTSNQYVVLCNGSPACRLEAKVYEPDFISSKVCGICIDRYGYGKSDLYDYDESNNQDQDQQNPPLLQYGYDMFELLTQGLQINTFCVIGASAGGMNALALLYVATKVSATTITTPKIPKAALIAPIGPIYQTGTAGMSKFFQFFLFLGRYAPSIVAFLLRSMLVGNKEKILKDPSHLDTMDDGFIKTVGGSDIRIFEIIR